MCTIALAWQVFEDAPVVLAANRDETADRSSDPPRRRNWGATVVAPADERAGGTWIGYNEHGVVAALANRWTDGNRSGDRSRGLLVRDVLGCTGTEAAVRAVERELDDTDYEGFNLVVADGTAAFLVEYDGRRRLRQFDPGVHVVVNVGADGRYEIPDPRSEAGTAQAENADRLRTALRPEPGEDSETWLQRSREAIADHENGVCIHHDGFGTVSSTLIRLADRPTYHYADGPPCETEYRRIRDTVTD